ncbi:ethyl tert-butyl ether degradation EthD, partial [Lasiosphaeris hirsuta]
SLTLIYPNDSLANYEMEYLVDKHMPIVQEHWGLYGLSSWNVTEFTLGPEGTPLVFAFAATINSDKREPIAAALAGVDIHDIMDDVTNFSNKQPIILVGESAEKSAGVPVV